MFAHLIGGDGLTIRIVVLVLFFGVALLVTWYVLPDRRRSHLRRMEAMPLDDGQPVERDGR